MDLMDRVSDIVIPHLPGKSFRMRIGINTGVWFLSYMHDMHTTQSTTQQTFI